MAGWSDECQSVAVRGSWRSVAGWCSFIWRHASASVSLHTCMCCLKPSACDAMVTCVRSGVNPRTPSTLGLAAGHASKCPGSSSSFKCQVAVWRASAGNEKQRATIHSTYSLTLKQEPLTERMDSCTLDTVQIARLAADCKVQTYRLLQERLSTQSREPGFEVNLAGCHKASCQSGACIADTCGHIIKLPTRAVPSHTRKEYSIAVSI